YRREKEDMPAYEEEIKEAEKEGVKIYTLVAPKSIIEKDGKVEAIECVRMSLGEFDAGGRRRPVPIEGSEFTMPVETIIAAIGQVPDTSFLNGDGIKVAKNGTIEVDIKSFSTTKPGIFAAGDNVRGPASVVEAIADGKKSAQAIDIYLGGDGVLMPSYREQLLSLRVSYNEEEYQKEREREEMPHLPLTERYRNFKEVVLGYPLKKAIEEAKRCLHCYIRESEAEVKVEGE
ncbi:MAG: FAD-dependent oxidoreductase, partial [Syntrophorhabdaceae bacterium]|nr:FAD-dependent oxidoreductase [Syntrophorhabdaceae bacterium]